jgi:hypothetical protein
MEGLLQAAGRAAKHLVFGRSSVPIGRDGDWGMFRIAIPTFACNGN